MALRAAALQRGEGTLTLNPKPNRNPSPNPSPSPNPNPNPNPKQDCVGGLSVRLQFNQEERWTTAFKCLLQDLKWLQAWHAAA